MADRVQLIAELIDKVTGPAMKAGGALSSLKRKVGGFAGASMSKAQKAFVSVGAGLSAFSGRVATAFKGSSFGKALTGMANQTSAFGRRMGAASMALGRDMAAGFQQSKFGQAFTRTYGKIAAGAKATGAKIRGALHGALDKAGASFQKRREAKGRFRGGDEVNLSKTAPSMLGKVGAAVAGVLPSAQQLGSAFGRASQKVVDFTKNALLIGGAVAAGIGAAIGKLTIGMVNFSQRSNVAFSLLAKDGASPAKLFEHARKLAGEFGLDVMDTTKTFQKFLALQFDPAQATALIKMGADMQALGASGEEVQRIMSQLGQIKAKGKLQGEELIVLAENGLSTELVYKSLAKQMGISMDEVKKKVSSGAVDASNALNAIGSAILMKTGTSEFGQAGKKMATATLSGMGGVLMAGMQNMFFDVGAKAEPAIVGAFRPIFDDLMGFMKGPSGAAFATGIADAVTGVANFIRAAIPIVQEFFRSFGGAALSGIRAVFEALSIFSSSGTNWIDVIKGIGTALGYTVAFLFGVATVITGLFVGAVRLAAGVLNGLVAAFNFVVASIGNVILWFDNVSARVSAFMTQILAIPGQIIAGLVNGIMNGTGAAVEAVAGLGSAMLGAIKRALGIASPSKEFMYLGEMSAIGFQRGMNDVDMGAGAAGIDMSVPSPSFASGQQAAAGAGAGGSVSVAVTNHITIPGATSPAETAKAVERASFSSLGAALEEARIETAA